jgi:hypothetical protein
VVAAVGGREITERGVGQRRPQQQRDPAGAERDELARARAHAGDGDKAGDQEREVPDDVAGGGRVLVQAELDGTPVGSEVGLAQQCRHEAGERDRDARRHPQQPGVVDRAGGREHQVAHECGADAADGQARGHGGSRRIGTRSDGDDDRDERGDPASTEETHIDTDWRSHGEQRRHGVNSDPLPVVSNPVFRGKR